MNIKAMSEVSIKKWGERTQLYKTVEELNELAAQTTNSFFINNQGRSLEDNQERLASEIADVETMLTQVSIILKKPFKYPDLDNVEQYILTMPSYSDVRNALVCFNTGSVAILRSIGISSDRRYLEDWFQEVQCHIAIIKRSISPERMLRKRIEKAHKFANYLGDDYVSR